MLQRELLHRRGVQLHTASGRTIGLGQYQGNFKSCSVYGRECNCSEFWRARKNDAHDQRTASA